MKNESTFNRLLSVFLTMLKIGAFTFGGGYAMISLLENEFVSKKKWIGRDEFLDLIAISESTPGPIAINASTYIGYKCAGTLGSVIATVGMCLPSFVLIFLISLFFDAFLELTPVACAFRGVQVCVIYLILTAGLKMLKDMRKTVFNVTLTLGVLISMLAVSVFAVNFSAVLAILICGFVGVLAYLIRVIRDRQAEDKEAGE